MSREGISEMSIASLAAQRLEEFCSHLRVVLPAVQQQLAHAAREWCGVAVGGRERTVEGRNVAGGGRREMSVGEWWW